MLIAAMAIQFMMHWVHIRDSISVFLVIKTLNSKL